MGYPGPLLFPCFFDTNGDPLDLGYVYIGDVDENPIVNPVSVYWDSDLTVPAAQPLRTVSGFIVRNGSPSFVYTADDYSMAVLNRSQRLVYSNLNVPNLSGPGGSALIGFIQSGVGAVKRSMQSKARDIFSAFDFMTAEEIADVQAGTLLVDVTAALQAAIDAINNRHQKGALYLPAGAYLISSALSVPVLVSIYGEGGAYSDTSGGSDYGSVLVCQDCDGIRFTASGNSRNRACFRDFGIQRKSGSNRTGWTTFGQVAETEGVDILRLTIKGFNQAIVIDYMRYFSIEDCTIDARGGIILNQAGTGFIAGGVIEGNTIHYDVSGGVSAPAAAIFVGSSEGLTIFANDLYGYPTCIQVISSAANLRILSNTFNCTVYGCDISTAQNGLAIRDNFFEMIVGTAALAAIRFSAIGSGVLFSENIVEGNTILATGAVPNCSGIVITSGQDHISATRNLISGMGVADISASNPGKLQILYNRCTSTAVTAAISLGMVNTLTPGGGAPILIDGNECYESIDFIRSDFTGGKVILGHNTKKGGTFTADIAGTTMTVSALGTDTFLEVGQTFTGTGVTSGTTISSFGTFTNESGVGTITVSASQTVASTTMTLRNIPDWKGKFVATYTGFTATITDQIFWNRTDRLVDLQQTTNFVSGTSNSTSKTITLPAFLWPGRDRETFCATEDNSAALAMSLVAVRTATGNVEFSKNPGGGAPTAGGTFGVQMGTLVYQL